MALSIGSQDSVSFLLTIQARGLLTLTLVGLSPTEYASLRWTHQHAGLSRRTPNWEQLIDKGMQNQHGLNAMLDKDLPKSFFTLEGRSTATSGSAHEGLPRRWSTPGSTIGDLQPNAESLVGAVGQGEKNQAWVVGQFEI
jgi:hypothetical protein